MEANEHSVPSVNAAESPSAKLEVIEEENITVVTANTNQIEKLTIHAEEHAATQESKSNQLQLENTQGDKKIQDKTTLKEETKSVDKDRNDTIVTNTDSSFSTSSVNQGIQIEFVLIQTTI